MNKRYFSARRLNCLPLLPIFVLLSFTLNCHVTGVWLPSQSAPGKHNQEKKAQIPNHAIFVSCSVHLINLVPRALPTNHFSGASHAEGPGDEVVHLIWTHYVRKGLWAFYFNYPQINEVRKSNHMTLVGKLGSCYGRGALKKQRVRPEK